MDEIANAPECAAERSQGETRAPSGWNQLATESREWRTRFLVLHTGRTKHLEKIDEWCIFTGRAKTKMNAFLGPVTEMR